MQNIFIFISEKILKNYKLFSIELICIEYIFIYDAESHNILHGELCELNFRD